MQTNDSPAKHNVVLPDASSKLSKKEQVADMFNNIAGKYDFLNHFLSLGIDKGWRRKAIRSLASVQPTRILDVATGTADLAIAASGTFPNAHIVGVDIAAQMLEVGRKKLTDRNLSSSISLNLGDSEQLPFDDNEFDAVMCAYGVRNFEHLEKGLAEMCRVMRPGGKLAILEFSSPRQFPVKQLFAFYFKVILPLMGKIVSRHSRAYTYLPESVSAFPEGKEFCKMLERAGFRAPQARPLSFGITTLYTASK